MSHDWDKATEEGIFLDPLFMDFQLGNNDTQCPSLDPIFETLFDSGNGHGHHTNGDGVAWEWTGNPSPKSSQAKESRAQDTTAGHSNVQVTSELAQKVLELESYLESRFEQLEEKFNTLRNGLEKDTIRFCNEIEENVQKLRKWAAEVEVSISQVEKLRNGGQ